MSELLPTASDLAWQALLSANAAFDIVKDAETELIQRRDSGGGDPEAMAALEEKLDDAQTEFFHLQDMAAIVYGRTDEEMHDPLQDFVGEIDTTKPIAMRVIAEIVTHRSNAVFRERMRDHARRLFGDLTGVRVAVEVSELRQLPEAVEGAPLDEPIKERLGSIFGDSYASKGARLVGALTRDGIHTLRDVLMVGGEEIRYVRYLSIKSVEVLRLALKLTDPTLTLLEKPTVIDMVQWCDDVSQIPARVLHPYFCQGAYMSVQKLAASTPEELVKIIEDAQSTCIHVDERFTSFLIEKAKKFSEEFQAAKAAIAHNTKGEV